MNWRLILYLSLYGLIMAIATVYWIPSRTEPIFWLIIFIACAYIIAKKCTGDYFWHGFAVSVFNGIWVTAAHFILFDAYMENHPEAVEMNKSIPAIFSPRTWMLVIGPAISIVSGLVLGLFSWVASKLIKKTGS
jgi:hypothetical protein